MEPIAQVFDLARTAIFGLDVPRIAAACVARASALVDEAIPGIAALVDAAVSTLLSRAADVNALRARLEQPPDARGGGGTGLSALAELMATVQLKGLEKGLKGVSRRLPPGSS